MDINEVFSYIESNITQPLWGNWYIKEKIGSGAFSAVYRVEAQRLNRTDVSALKIEPIIAGDTLFPNDERKISYIENKKRLVENESTIMYKLKSCPYIVAYEEEDVQELKVNGKFEGYYFLIRMELLTGLADLIQSGQLDLSESAVIQLAKQIGQGIKAAHDIGIIHRDIKPANFFISKDGVYKLGDFNVSKQSDTARTFAGTIGYLAPEIYRAKSNVNECYTQQADIYSFGICLYQFMNDFYMPFEREYSMEAALDKRMSGERLPEPVNSSYNFGRIILKACAFNTSERYRTIDEMLFDLNKLEFVSGNRAAYEPKRSYNSTNYATASAMSSGRSGDNTVTFFSDAPSVARSASYRNPSNYADGYYYQDSGVGSRNVQPAYAPASLTGERNSNKAKTILVGLMVILIIAIVACISSIFVIMKYSDSDEDYDLAVTSENSELSDISDDSINQEIASVGTYGNDENGVPVQSANTGNFEVYYVTGIADTIPVKEIKGDSGGAVSSLRAGDEVYLVNYVSEDYAYIYLEQQNIYGYIKKYYIVNNQSAVCKGETYYIKEKTSIYSDSDGKDSIKTVAQNTKITVIAKTAGEYWFVNLSDTNTFGYVENAKISSKKIDNTPSAASSKSSSVNSKTESVASSVSSKSSSSSSKNSTASSGSRDVSSSNAESRVSSTASEAHDAPIFRSISESSHLTSEDSSYTYDCTNVLRDDGTCWCEGVSGTGVGEYILFENTTTQYVNGIVIVNGYSADEERFLNNGRVTKLRFEFSDGTSITKSVLPNNSGKQSISFDGEIATTYVKIIIEDAVEGDKYDDTCISLLAPY